MKKASRRNDMVVTYRSAMLHEVEMVAEALEKANVPFYKRQEIGTTQVAMPFQPSHGPGLYWTIIIPRRYRSEARKVISQLPVSKEMYPDVWGFKPSSGARKFFKAYAVYIIITAIMSLVFIIIEIFKK